MRLVAKPDFRCPPFHYLGCRKGDEMSRADLKETADQAGDQTTFMESIKGWMMLLGILAIISLLLRRASESHGPSRSWAILIVIATT